MLKRTIELVKDKIKGTRKGLNTPTYMHSIRVYNLLKEYGYSSEVQLAGLLHDMIEDAGFTKEALLSLGYPENIVKLVCLSSHDANNPDKFGRREDMIKGLISADNIDARAIKLADISDNLTECHFMQKDKLERFLFKKAPIFVYYGNKYFGGTEFYTNFLERYYRQIKLYINYNL
ncbi:hypothetical protein BSK20_03600 [SR1 bacterium human oral taxon HOT-345]|nr:hypothetical protein BSK20_03600 [SR1 bacterium human oral taxon HOT-345]